MTTHRPERVAAVVQEVLTRLLREEVHDPGIGFVTITEVRVSPDLKHARVYVSSMGNPAGSAPALAALSRAAPFLRRALGRQTRLRHAPELHFHEDTVLATGFRVDRILDEIREDRPASEEPEDDRGPVEP